MVIKSNMRASNANRQLGVVSGAQQKSMEKLSSGYQVNRSADDAAGLAISEKMRRQVRGLTQASQNAQDGVSFCQIADGALNEVHDMLKRSKELAIKASNATLSDDDRSMIQEEIKQLSSEIDRVHNTAVFNEKWVFSNGGKIAPTHGGLAQDPNDRMISVYHFGDFELEVSNGLIGSGGVKQASPSAQAAGAANPSAIENSDLAKFVEKAAAYTVSKMASTFPNLFAAASSSGVKVGLELDNIDGAGGTLAYASIGLSWGASTTTNYTMKVDTSDYPLATFPTATDAQKADLANTVAHEMTHLMMYDTLTTHMFDGNVNSLPDWFVEGMAQTVGGAGGGWFNPASFVGASDSTYINYMKQIETMPYGAGYLGCMILGQAVTDQTNGVAVGAGASVTNATIASGLDKLMTDMAKNGKSLDQAIKDNTSFSGYNDFVNRMKSGSGGTLAEAKKIVGAMGAGGAGGLIGPLNTPKNTLFAPATINAAALNPDYQIMRGVKAYANQFNTPIDWPAKAPTGGATNDNNAKDFYLQIGAEKGQGITVDQFNVSAKVLMGGQYMDVSTIDSAQRTISMVDDADARVSYIRSYYGATQNRLEHTIKNLDNVVENTTSAESRIRDTDMATEMVRLSMLNVLQQAGTSMLAQANQSNQGVLSLLG